MKQCIHCKYTWKGWKTKTSTITRCPKCHTTYPNGPKIRESKIIPQTPNWTPEENPVANPAYMAGYLDGDGCISINKCSRFRLNISVTSKRRIQLDAIKTLYGGSISIRTVKGIPYYCWNVSGYKAMKLLEFVFPYLRCKHYQATLGMISYSLMQPHFPTYRDKISEHDMKIRREIYQQIRTINSSLTQTFSNYETTPKNINAYTAGLTDAEGSISILRGRNRNKHDRTHMLSIYVGNDNLQVCQWLAQHFEGKVFAKKPRRNGKTAYQWSITGQRAASFLMKTFPFIHLKSGQAMLGLAFRHDIQETFFPQGGVPEHELRKREKYCQLMNYCNQTALQQAKKKLYQTQHEQTQTGKESFGKLF